MELVAIQNAMVASDRAALETWGGINGALSGFCVLDAACAGRCRSWPAITTGRTWRSKRMPEWIPARGADEAA